MEKDLIYFIGKNDHSPEAIEKILTAHPEIKFVSAIGVDLTGNDTDERIPIGLFLKDIKGFLDGAVQTDGSSVVLPGIATLNNAKVDMVADTEVSWFVDYNYENIDYETEKPVGTLRIPCFLRHEGKFVDSRYLLKSSIDNFSKTLLQLFKDYPEKLSPYGVTIDEIDEITATCATELEFWVQTPNDVALVEKLSTSQILKEQYWQKTKGAVRTALEESLTLMAEYGIDPEMGHKEVGGVKAKLDSEGNLDHIMEQLEIDWKYSTAVQAADNELFVRYLVSEVFRSYGLDVTFKAKPIEGVAGSGEHTHVGMAMKLKSGKFINLFTATKEHFLSSVGYASVMGVLNNYEVINPFVSSTNDSLRRLKPGFEAPICIVTSLGHSVDVPSRNRTVLMGLVRDELNPLATRFELRAPNPYTNTYVALSALYSAMLDGIEYAFKNGRDEDSLLAELSKKPGEEADYLAKERAYRSEEDVFEDFTPEERDAFFSKAPATVYENFAGFDKYPEKKKVLVEKGVFTDKLIASIREGYKDRWITEVDQRIISKYIDEIRGCKMLHCADKALDLDIKNWMKINELRLYLMKDSVDKNSLFTQIKLAAEAKDYAKVSDLQLELENKMDELRTIYTSYKKNLLDI